MKKLRPFFAISNFKRTSRFLILVFVSAVFWTCTREEAVDVYTPDEKLIKVIKAASFTGDIRDFIIVDGKNLDEIPNQDPKNPINPTKVELGRMLFHEPALGVLANKPEGMNTFSCASCHIAKKGFTAGRIQGIADGAFGFGQAGEGRSKFPSYHGDEVDAQGARPLPTINLAYVRNALWAGSFGSFSLNEGTEAVWDQDTLTAVNHLGLEGLEANNIRALQVHRMLMNEEMAGELGYKYYFDKAFPEVPVEERYTLKTTSCAIAAYFRSITTNEAPFQKWLKGDHSAMTEQQKRGAELFFTKAGCVRCHNSPSFNSFNFFALGVYDLYQNNVAEVFRTGPNDKRVKGRAGFTGNPNDLYKFKVPQLYNLKNVGFYFHGGSKQSLREVVEYFNEAKPENPLVPSSQISGFFKPLQLNEQEINDLTEFLENGLFDPTLEKHVPDRVLSFMCFPDNDEKSKKDLNCN
ncbi:MAG TPA: cytochrome c peroxidase [Saprospiraceae bacterium]|nr:cytochrome c peroxidase [Saprospiraceae bacterium]